MEISNNNQRTGSLDFATFRRAQVAVRAVEGLESWPGKKKKKTSCLYLFLHSPFFCLPRIERSVMGGSVSQITLMHRGGVFYSPTQPSCPRNEGSTECGLYKQPVAGHSSPRRLDF